MIVKSIPIRWHSNLSIYASESFLRTVGDEYGWLGGVDDTGRLRCILPYTIIKKAGFFRLVRFRVETIRVDDEVDVAEEKSFLDGVVHYFRGAGADLIIPATTNTIFRTYPDNAVAAPYGTFIMDLKKTEDELWNELNQNSRKKIRRALRNGASVCVGAEYIDVAYELIRNTFKFSNIRFMGFPSFRRIVEGLGENVRIYVVKKNNRIQGAMVVPFSQFGAYALHSGRISNSEPGAMNLLRWETILELRTADVSRFDSVGVRIDPEKGSKQEGIFLYKKSFGGQLVRGFMWKYCIKPVKSSAYSLAIRCLRGGDIVDQEGHKMPIKPMDP